MIYDPDILNKFSIIKNKGIFNNIIMSGNNHYLNNLYLNKFIEIVYGKNVIKKIPGVIDIHSCKYYIKFSATNIQNDKFIELLTEYINCKNIINLRKIFIIYNLENFSSLNISYLKNIVEKYKIIIIGSMKGTIHNISYHNIIIKNIKSKDDTIKYSIYYNILDNYYKKINSNNFISYTDQLSKQLNKYLYDFSFMVNICFDFFIDKCSKPIDLIQLCTDAEYSIIKHNTKTICFNKLIFNILKLYII